MATATLLAIPQNEPIEINDDFAAAIELGSNLQVDKVYAASTSNETWWYEQPQTTHVLASCVTSVEVPMTTQTPPKNPRNVTKNIVIQENIVHPHVPSTKSPSTPTSINKVGYNKKGLVIQVRSIRNTGVKRKCFTTHKTMVEATERGTKELIVLMECIHAQTLEVEEKWLEYLKEHNKSFS
jgi:hypothetical protein